MTTGTRSTRSSPRRSPRSKAADMSPRTRKIRCYAVAVTATLAAGTLDASTVVAAPAPVLGAPAATSTTPSAYAGRQLPGRVGAPARVKQLITVTSPGWSTTARDPQGVAQGCRGALVPGSWTAPGQDRLPRLGAAVASVGSRRARPRRAATGCPTRSAGSPTRARTCTTATSTGTDWWPYEPRDPATYNVWQWHKARTTHWRADKAEHLWTYDRQYAYGIVIGFNLPHGIRYSHRHRQWVADHRADTEPRRRHLPARQRHRTDRRLCVDGALADALADAMAAPGESPAGRHGSVRLRRHPVSAPSGNVGRGQHDG